MHFCGFGNDIIFCVLVYLVPGFIVGNAGLLMTLLQFLIAYKILVFTVASICAISTNGAVEGGGAYCILFYNHQLTFSLYLCQSLDDLSLITNNNL